MSPFVCITVLRLLALAVAVFSLGAGVTHLARGRLPRRYKAFGACLLAAFGAWRTLVGTLPAEPEPRESPAWQAGTAFS